MLKKFVCFAAALFTIVAVYSSEARGAEKKIGILVWSEENYYLVAKNALVDELKKDGFGEPSVKFTTENAHGNKAKAAELAQKFASARYDMVIAVGTSAAVAAAKDIKNIPLVFSFVYDPVESKIASDWKSSGNNTTGTSSKVPMSQLLATLKQLAPVKRIAVLYTPGEKNSEAQLKDIEALESETRIKPVPVPLTRREEVASVVSDVVGAADAAYITGSSIVGTELKTILDAATKARVITVTHLADLVDKGVLLGVCADPRAVGMMAGDKAAKVLNGARPSSVPIEALKKLDVIVNMQTARAGQIQIPASFSKIVTKKVE